MTRTFKRVKTPTVLGMEAVECGAVSLAIILGYHGKVLPLEELRLACGVSRDGSKASNVLKAARSYGMEAKGFRCEPGELQSMEFPVVLFWDFNHFLVLEGFGKDVVYLNDPAYGPRKVSHAELDKSFTGVVLTFKPTDSFRPGGVKRTIPARILPRLRGLELALLFIVAATLSLVVPGLLIPTYTKVFIDQYLISGYTDWIRPLLLAMGITAIVNILLTHLQQKYLLRLERRLSLVNSSSFMWHVLRLPLEFFQQRFAGDVVQRVNSNETVAELLSGDLATNLVNVLLMMFFAFLMFQYDEVLTLMSIALAGINVGFMRFMGRMQRDSALRIQQDQAKLISKTMGGIQIVETLKATGGEKAFLAQWAGHNAKVINANQEIGLPMRMLEALPSVLDSLSRASILGYGGYQVMGGSMTIGSLVAFQSLLSSFMTPVNQLVGLMSKVQTIESDVTRLDDVLLYPVDPVTQTPMQHRTEDPADPAGTASPVKLHGHLELRNVTFGYSRLEPPLISDFNLELKPGKRVALVGGSGSGKSTIAKMVVGLNKPWSGEILFDGRPREAIPRGVLSGSVAHVDQDIVLFAGTTKDNLTMWDGNVPERAVLHATVDAQIHPEITARPGGYDSPVGERGSNFSGGQAQRLEIARALVNNPSLLIMDEATSALDPLTEQLIDDSIRRRGCACLIVAHRLSTIRDADEIVVMHQGKVVQRGTHESLLQEDGPYSRLIGLEQ